jgi:phosphonoacetaldehyde hydrolase
MAPEGRLRAVILDMAGTIVDYGSCAPAGVFIEVFKRRGVEITVAEARGPMGAHKRDHIAAIARMPGVAERWRSANGGEATEADIDAMYAELIPLQLAVLPEYSELIPGTLAFAEECRRRRLSIGTTTGYNREMIEVVLAEMKRQGFAPDVAVCVDDVPAGRPEPWMALFAAMKLRAYPMSACVKVGDTLPDIAEGTNAGMWTVAVAATGNEMGLSEAEAAALPVGERDARLEAASERLRSSCPHYVVDGIADVVNVLDEIEARLARGERP